MDFIAVHERERIARFARRNPFLHAYELGDLDDFFWPHTTWYARERGDELEQLVLLYTGGELPTVLALAEEPTASMRDLLRALRPALPRRFYAHLSESVATACAETDELEPHGLHRKMGLRDATRLAAYADPAAVRLSPADLDAARALYEESYPGNWFIPRMLETGYYYGLREGGRLVSIAGVHVCAPGHGVAALGNITTHPAARGRGLGARVTARVCAALLADGIATIGLNVKADNAAALACYTRLGFEHVADYGEYLVEAKDARRGGEPPAVRIP